MFVYADICKTIVSRKHAYCLSNLVNIIALIMPYFLFIRKKITEFKIEICKLYAVMTVWVKPRRTPDSITKFGLVVNIRFIHDNESPIMRVGFLIICSNPNWDVTPSRLETSYVVMSLLYQRLSFALKSPRTTVGKGLYES